MMVLFFHGKKQWNAPWLKQSMITSIHDQIFRHPDKKIVGPNSNSCLKDVQPKESVMGSRGQVFKANRSCTIKRIPKFEGLASCELEKG